MTGIRLFELAAGASTAQVATPPADALHRACGTEPGWACEQVFDWTGNSLAAKAADLLVGIPSKVLLVIVVAWVVNRLVRRAIRRFTERVAKTAQAGQLGAIRSRTPSLLLGTGSHSLRAAARAETVGSVLRSLATAVIYSIAFVTILGELGISLGPIIASAGIAGVALGFGAQSLVKDFLSGVFMLIEDQYGVGDIVDVGEANGTVEEVSLRTTKIRDVHGSLWFVPNGQINRVANKSQEWARALLDISLAYETDIRHAEAVIKEAAEGLWGEPVWRGRLLEPPEIWGIESISASGIELRLVIKTRPSEQFAVMRELRIRIKDALDAAGIKRPFVQKTMLVPDSGVVPAVRLDGEEPLDGEAEAATSDEAAPDRDDGGASAGRDEGGGTEAPGRGSSAAGGQAPAGGRARTTRTGAAAERRGTERQGTER